MQESLIVMVIIGLNAIITYSGFSRPDFLEKFILVPYRIVGQKEYLRLIGSGFLHADWTHFAFNMFTLYSFGSFIEMVYGFNGLLIIYVGSLLGGNILATFLHRNQFEYRALGASGAVSGVVFATILAEPSLLLNIMFIPIGIPAWLIGLAFVVWSIYGIQKKNDNIGHDAHLGGALTGLALAIALAPAFLIQNPWVVLLLGLPAIVFLLWLIKKEKNDF